jgi:hypothetical protein
MKLDGGVEMTAFIVGRPKRKRPTDRVNYKLDSDLRALLASIAERQGRNEGAQVEQLILFYEAVERLNADGQNLTLDAINAKKNQLWTEITANDVDGEPGDD